VDSSWRFFELLGQSMPIATAPVSSQDLVQQLVGRGRPAVALLEFLLRLADLASHFLSPALDDAPMQDLGQSLVIDLRNPSDASSTSTHDVAFWIVRFFSFETD
jgi:hypothetical protein